MSQEMFFKKKKNDIETLCYMLVNICKHLNIIHQQQQQ